LAFVLTCALVMSTVQRMRNAAAMSVVTAVRRLSPLVSPISSVLSLFVVLSTYRRR
jgi:hypothetical protein